MDIEQKEKLTNFLLPRGIKRCLHIYSGGFKIEIARGYRGKIRNDFTIIIYSKSYSTFLKLNEDVILNSPELPKFRSSGIKADTWIGIAQSAVFLANMKAYKKRSCEEEVFEDTFKTGERLVSDAMYISPHRYETFVSEVVKRLSTPKDLFDAVRRDGLLTKNVPPWHTFYFFIYSAKLAEVDVNYVISELKKFKDYFGFEDLNYESIEKFYKTVQIQSP